MVECLLSVRPDLVNSAADTYSPLWTAVAGGCQDIVTLLYRWHEENISHDIDGLGAAAVDALKVTMDRRRGRSGSERD